MNRAIKFRAWNAQYKTLEPVNFLLDKADGDLEVDYDGNLGEPLGVDGENIVLEQFTGLKDQSGVEIFEGDILLIEDGDCEITKCDTGIGSVEFLADHGLWYVDGQLNNGLFDLHRENYLSVVGNIHQHPELLK